MTPADDELLARAEALLARWPQRRALLPRTKPLSADWLPAQSPQTGQAGTWWSWSAEHPTRLTDATCQQLLPDEFPYANHAALCAYQAALRQPEDFQTLARATELTGDPRYALAFVDLLAQYSTLYPTFPVTFYQDAGEGNLKCYGPEVQGKHYTARVGDSWMDTYDLQRWLKTYRLVQACVAVPPEKDHAVRELTREILEFESLPNFLYVNDKYHNSLTNYYDVFALAGTIWGPDLVVRDTLRGTTYSGGDLLQLAVHGPKGLRRFADQAFDRNGVYWELSASYTGYIFGYLEGTLKLLRGLGEPAGYVPGEAVRPYYEKIEHFDPAAALPELWRGVLAQARLALNNGLYPPGNDSNYLNGPTAEWLESWADLLDSEPVRRWARGVRASSGAAPAPDAEPFPPRGSTLFPACGAATLRGPANRLNVHLDWHQIQDYHSHLDPLNLAVTADGYLVISDLGYHLGHPLRHILSERTAAHSTVTVDRTDCSYHDRGVLHDYLGEGEVQFVDASVPSAYSPCSIYRRTVVLVGDRYVLDFFRVEGGNTHDYALLSRADDSRGSAPLTEYPGTLADPHGSYAGFDHLPSDQIFPAEPYEVLHRPRLGPAPESFTVDWVQRDRPDLTSRVHHLAGPGAQLLLARAPHRDRRADLQVRTDELLIVRRSGSPPLRSHFLSVLETLSASSPPLKAVRRLEVQSRDPFAAAAEVVHEGGTDLILHALEEGPHHLPARGLTLHGRFLAVRAGQLLALRGRLSGTLGHQTSKPSQGARVRKVDLTAGAVEIEPALSAPEDLSGQFVVVRGGTGLDEWWRIARASADGRTLFLDRDHAQLIALQGTVEGLENPRVIISGVNFCGTVPRGTPLRIGPVGDFSSTRVEVACVRQTGLPLRTGGTTTNQVPRTCYLCLERRAALSEADIGKPFWSSGIEVGDYLLVPERGLASRTAERAS